MAEFYRRLEPHMHARRIGDGSGVPPTPRARQFAGIAVRSASTARLSRRSTCGTSCTKRTCQRAAARTYFLRPTIGQEQGELERLPPELEELLDAPQPVIVIDASTIVAIAPAN